MGDWTNFIKGVGTLFDEASKVREEYLRTKSQPKETLNNPESKSIHPDSYSRPLQEVEEQSLEQHEGSSEVQMKVSSDEQKNQNQGTSGEKSSNTGTFAALGVAGIALGAYAAYKVYTGREKNQSVVINSQSDCKNQLKLMQQDVDEFPVIGMDCQWLTNPSPYEPRNPIALLQLATHKGNILLFPMKKFPVPEELRKILSSAEVIKTGIDVFKDARYLREDYDLSVDSTFDLRFLAEGTGHKPEELENLALDVLKLNISREKDTINSDWEKLPLDQQQINFAKTTVEALINIFKALYPLTGNEPTIMEVLNYCSANKDRPFIWDADKLD